MTSPFEYVPSTMKFWNCPAAFFTVSGDIASETRTGVDVGVGVGVFVRVGVTPVLVGVGVGASTTSKVASPPDASVPTPVSASTAEMIAVPIPTAFTRLLPDVRVVRRDRDGRIARRVGHALGEVLRAAVREGRGSSEVLEAADALLGR